MAAYTELVQKLIKELSRFPGIGPRSAERMVFHILRSDKLWVNQLSETILRVKEEIFFCQKCNNLSEEEVCHICSDQKRDKSIICVVEEPKDIIFLEKSKSFTGLYHVLLGALSPLNGVGPKELKIKELMDRVAQSEVKEIIVATNCTTDGEATALYLQKILSPFEKKISRIACGVPRGSNLEYVDQDTLACAVAGRIAMISS